MYARFGTLLSIVALCSPAPVAAAGTPKLEVPVGCTVGTTCFVTQYFDHDAGAGRKDYRCGTLLGDGHDGIDFRIRRGAGDVPVLAAADGTVLRVRDGMTDRSVRAPGAAVPPDRMAGNGVLIDHGAFTTQYSHLKQGSVAVASGQRVKAGQQLGLVGMSGHTEYLHLHFSVRSGDEKIDPFTAGSGAIDCAAGSADGLWSSAARGKLAYAPTGVADAGLSPGRPNVIDARAGGLPALGPNPPALVLWADSFGTRPGDEERFVLRAPSGDVLLDRRQPIAKGTLVWFSFAGVPRPASGWASGVYSGEYALIRGGRTVGTMKVSAALSGR